MSFGYLASRSRVRLFELTQKFIEKIQAKSDKYFSDLSVKDYYLASTQSIEEWKKCVCYDKIADK
jgi:hypothetical protein